MTMLRISKNDLLVLDNVRHEIVHVGKVGVEIRSLDRNRRSAMRTHDDLASLYFDDRLGIEREVAARLPRNLARVITRDPDSFPEKDQREGWRRYEYVALCDRFFTEQPRTGRPRASRTIAGYARIGRVCAWMRRREQARLAGRPARSSALEMVSGSALRQWHRNWVDSGRASSVLIPQHEAKGGVSQLSKQVAQIIAEDVDKFWLTQAKVPLRTVYAHIVHRLREHPCGLPVPSESTVRRWVQKNVDGYTKMRRREGQKRADQKFRAIASGPVTIRPLQNVEFDHTQLDVLVVKDPILAGEGRGAGLARPWLTAAICRTTRMIFGFYLGFERPSWVSIMNAMRMGVLPKESLLLGTGVENAWPVHGVPEVVICDNGKEFHSNSLQAAAAHLGFEIRYAPVRKPHLKGRIERFLGEVARDFLAFVPGKTFESVAARGDGRPESNPYPSLDDLQRQFLVWLVDVRHGSPHRGLAGMAPLQKWEAVSGYGVRMPPKVSDLTAYLGQVVDSSIQRKGIEFMGLFYQSKELSLLKKTSRDKGRKWSVKIDPYDLSHVFVLDEDESRWLLVPSMDTELTDGLTASEYRRIVTEARAMTKFGQKVLADTLLRARRKLLDEGLKMGAAKGVVTAADREWLEVNSVAPAVFVGNSQAQRDSENLRRLSGQAKRKASSAGKGLRKADGNSSASARPDPEVPQQPEDKGDGASTIGNATSGIAARDPGRRKRNSGEI
ncbi:MAG TPA: hypothetical protein ENH55_23255 [Aurantimonas coralicida]|uniref:Integrase catalytic domain-containing protein n=2 Tax=root TaxID=1 RepID=A0A9C9TIE9_9HYPH|nr:hypothetical protein [Aurantimonas coralicida]HEU02297.1 hypothetical protein [Aurantimonas coralicida]